MGLIQGDFCLFPRENISNVRRYERFLVVTTGGGVVATHLLVMTRNAAEHPAMGIPASLPTTTNDLAQIAGVLRLRNLVNLLTNYQVIFQSDSCFPCPPEPPQPLALPVLLAIWAGVFYIFYIFK